MEQQGALLGQILMAQGAINARDLDMALVAQQQMAGRLGTLLMRAGALSETQLLQALQVQLQLPLLEVDVAAPDVEQLKAALVTTGADINWLLQLEVAFSLHASAIAILALDLFTPNPNDH